MYVDKDMPLSDLLVLIKKCPKESTLYLEIEQNWKYGHSIVTVKQIKELLKDVYIEVQTLDTVAAKLFQSVDISLFEELPEEVRDFYDEIIPDKKFSTNKMGEAFESQQFEVVKIVREQREEHIHKVYETVQELPLRNKILLGIASIISVAIVSFVIALIAPSATITVQAEKKMIDSIVNCNFIKTEQSFLEPEKNHGNNFHLYPLEFRFEHEFNFPVLSKIFEGQNAEGQVKMYNNYYEDITLRDGTKIQTEDGMIFLTKHYVRIPARHKVTDEDGNESLAPGEALVDVVANDMDLYQEVIGSRGNIGASRFFVPGLTNYMQKFIWGESEREFSGGTTRWRIEAQESDIAAAQEKMENMLFTTAKEEIVQYIEEQNITSPYKVGLFPLERHIKKEIVKIDIPEGTIGTSIKEFPVKGQLLVSAFVFSQTDFQKFLKAHLETKRDPRMKVEALDFSTMTLRQFNETPAEIRVTASLKGRQSFQVDDFSEHGKDLQEKVKTKLTGMNVGEAHKVLSNMPEINHVQINVWPPVKKHLPLIADNIEIIEHE